MGKREKKAYLEAIRQRYRKASKQEKHLILDEFCEVCRYHRKHAIRLLRRRPKARSPRKAGRKSSYATTDFQLVLTRIWLATDVCLSRVIWP